MGEAISMSRKSLEAERNKALTDVGALDVEISAAETNLELLRGRRTFLQSKADQLAEGVAALREVERNGQE